MIKRKITETIEEFDNSGNIIRRTVTETEEDDTNTPIYYPYTPLPNTSMPPYPPLDTIYGSSEKKPE